MSPVDLGPVREGRVVGPVCPEIAWAGWARAPGVARGGARRGCTAGATGTGNPAYRDPCWDGARYSSFPGGTCLKIPLFEQIKKINCRNIIRWVNKIKIFVRSLFD